MRGGNEKGFALVAVLWLLILLAFLASSTSTSTRTGAYLTRNLEHGAQAEALADAGIYRVLWELVQSPSDRPLRTDGTVYEWVFGDGRVRLAVHDEAGKVDVNAAPEELLERLFLAVGVEEAGAHALAEAIAAVRAAGAAKADGGNAFRVGGDDRPVAEDGWFRSTDAVQQVPGMSAAVFTRIRPLITVYTGMAEPDVAVAPPRVRAAMQEWTKGSPERGGVPAAALLTDERMPPGGADDGDGGPFRVVEEGHREDSDEQPGRMAPAIVAIHAEGRMPSGAVFAREAIAAIGWASDFPRFYVWRQAPRQYFPLETPPAPVVTESPERNS